MIVKTVIENVLYPVWMISDGIAGTVSKGVRNVCYYGLNQEISWWHPIEKLHHYLDTTATCERMGNFTFESKYATVGALVGAGVFVCHYTKVYLRENEYKNYTSKTTKELNDLTPTQINAFKVGIKSAGSQMSYLGSWFSYDAWCAPRAYLAGVAAKKHDDNALINKVTKHKP